MVTTNATALAQQQRWLVVAVIFGITSLVEAAGFGQVLAFLPLYLQHVGVSAGEVPRWTGILFALTFVVGLPMVPFWGAWADRYSHKLIIIRSALVEAVVFGAIVLSRNRWELAAALILVGFQLGNTGVMMTALRSVTPARRVGLAISLLGSVSAVGLALGPATGGWLVDHTSLGLRGLFTIDALLSLGTAILMGITLPETKPAQVAAGSVSRAAWRTVQGVVTIPVIRLLFGSFTIYYLGIFIARPYLPLFVERIHPAQAGLAGAVGLVVGTAGLVGALAAPLAGAFGDRVGFSRVQELAALAAIFCLAAVALMPSVPLLAVAAGLLIACTSSYEALFFALLATRVPEDRRSATLNLALLPIYLAGIVGPGLAAVVVGAGLNWVIVVAGVFVTVALLAPRILSQPEEAAEPKVGPSIA